MANWFADQCRITAALKSEPHQGKYDNGQLAWRPTHICGNCLPFPCVRLADCERAVALMNERYPVENEEECKAAMLADFSKIIKLVEWLLSESIAW